LTLKETKDLSTEHEKDRVAVVGVGNALLSDEEVGVHVLRAPREFPLPAHVRVFELGIRGLELLEAVEDFSKVVIVDATESGAVHGSIQGWGLGEIIDTSGPRMISLHEIDLLTTLKIGRATGRLPDEVVIVGIGPKLVSPGLELAPELKAKFTQLLDLVLVDAFVTQALAM